jgi:hypothetical protein
MSGSGFLEILGSTNVGPHAGGNLLSPSNVLPAAIFDVK